LTENKRIVNHVLADNRGMPMNMQLQVTFSIYVKYTRRRLDWLCCVCSGMQYWSQYVRNCFHQKTTNMTLKYTLQTCRYKGV